MNKQITQLSKQLEINKLKKELRISKSLNLLHKSAYVVAMQVITKRENKIAELHTQLRNISSSVFTS